MLVLSSSPQVEKWMPRSVLFWDLCIHDGLYSWQGRQVRKSHLPLATEHDPCSWEKVNQNFWKSRHGPCLSCPHCQELQIFTLAKLTSVSVSSSFSIIGHGKEARPMHLFVTLSLRAMRERSDKGLGASSFLLKIWPEFYCWKWEWETGELTAPPKLAADLLDDLVQVPFPLCASVYSPFHSFPVWPI